jgi:hypothetical protein
MSTTWLESYSSHSAGSFDSRAAEAAFQSANNGPASAGVSNQFYSNPGDSDPFAFLSSGINTEGEKRTLPKWPIRSAFCHEAARRIES